MVPKHELPKSIPLHDQMFNYKTNVYELEDHVGEKDGTWTSWQNLGLQKKTFPTSFFGHLLESTWIESTSRYGLSPCHEEAKWDTIGVIGRLIAKLPHYTNFALIYPMENKMSLAHHVVKWWGYDYTDQNNKSLSERTQGHLMLKPPSPSWCRWSGNKGRYWAKMIIRVWIGWIRCLIGTLMIN